MQLYSLLFRSQQHGDYCRLAEVLRLSQLENSPGTPLSVCVVEAADRDILELGARRKALTKYVDNVRKTRHLHDIVQRTPDGQLLGLLDVDTMIVRDLSPIAAAEFDLAYTVRPPKSQWRINSGVVFLRTSPRVRAWFRTWLDITLQMLEDESFHNAWRGEPRFYGGINQAALGWLLEHQGNGVRRLKTLELPCAEWNSVSTLWGNPAERIVHVMSQLREVALGRSRSRDEGLNRVAQRWQEFDRRAREVAA